MTSETDTKYQQRNVASEFKRRPAASNGFWLCILLPLALTVNLWRKSSVSFEYKLTTFIAIGLFLQSIVIILRLQIERKITVVRAFPAAITSSLIFLLLKQNFIFSALIAITSKFTFHGIFFYTLKYLPKSFTYGEAFIVSQGITLFLVNIFMKFSTIFDYEPLTDMNKMTTISQVGLFGIAIIVGCAHFVNYFRELAFYPLLAVIGCFIISFPIGDNFAIVVLIDFIFSDAQRLIILTLYLGLVIVSVAAVIWHVSRNEGSNTRVRKIFHILIVLVFAPGFVFDCTFLFIASGVALALMILLETMRVIELWPFSDLLQQAVKAFIDEKDAGLIALTPIYLLVGCALPIWIHPNPCEPIRNEILPLLSGVLSVGIGDTAASFFGSKFGQHKWPNQIKSIEGTVAAIIAQSLLLPILFYFNLISLDSMMIGTYIVTIIINSLIETFTDQVDNLVLPLVTFILFSI